MENISTGEIREACSITIAQIERTHMLHSNSQAALDSLSQRQKTLRLVLARACDTMPGQVCSRHRVSIRLRATMQITKKMVIQKCPNTLRIAHHSRRPHPSRSGETLNARRPVRGWSRTGRQEIRYSPRGRGPTSSACGCQGVTSGGPTSSRLAHATWRDTGANCGNQTKRH